MPYAGYMNNDSSHIPTIAELYPHLTPEEQQEAEENLTRYLEAVLQIYNRISLERGDFDSLKDK